MAQLPVIQITPPFVAGDDRSAMGNAFYTARCFIRRGNRIIPGQRIRRRFIQTGQKFNVLAGDILVMRLMVYPSVLFRLAGEDFWWMHIIGDPRYPNYLYNMANLRLKLVLVRDNNNEDIVFADWLPFTGVRYDVFVKKNAAGNPVSQGTSGTKLTIPFRFGYIFRREDIFQRIDVPGELHVRQGLNNPHPDPPRVAALFYENEVINGQAVKVWLKTVFLAAKATVGAVVIAPTAMQKTTTRFNRPVARLIRTRQRMARREIQRRLRMFARQTQRAYAAWIRQMADRQRQLMRIAGPQGMRAFRRSAQRAFFARAMANRMRFMNFQPMTLAGPRRLTRRMARQELARMGFAVGRASGDAQALGRKIEEMAKRINALEQEIKRLSKQLQEAYKTANQKTKAGIDPSKGSGKGSGGGGNGSGTGGNGTNTKTDIIINDLYYEPWAIKQGLYILVGDTDKQIDADMPDNLITIKLNDSITDVNEKRFTNQDDRLHNPRLFFFKKGNPVTSTPSFNPSITSQNSPKYNFRLGLSRGVSTMSSSTMDKIASTLIKDIKVQSMGEGKMKVRIELSHVCNSTAKDFENNVSFKAQHHGQTHKMTEVKVTKYDKSFEFKGKIHRDILRAFDEGLDIYIIFSNIKSVFKSEEHPVPAFYNGVELKCSKITS
jgi:hypothetical protein